METSLSHLWGKRVLSDRTMLCGFERINQILQEHQYILRNRRTITVLTDHQGKQVPEGRTCTVSSGVIFYALGGAKMYT